MQDGTNAQLKNPNEPVSELFQDYKTLVEKIQKKFNPDFLTLLEVPPLRKTDNNKLANERIIEYNECIQSFAVMFNSDEVNVLYLHNSMSMLSNYNMLLFDNIHLNYQYGLPFLKSVLVPILLKTSNENTMPTGRNRYANARFNYYRPNQYAHQSYNYMRNF